VNGTQKIVLKIEIAILDPKVKKSFASFCQSTLCYLNQPKKMGSAMSIAVERDGVKENVDIIVEKSNLDVAKTALDKVDDVTKGFCFEGYNSMSLLIGVGFTLAFLFIVAVVRACRRFWNRNHSKYD
jgi:hypothetical protein